jgi:hypothetical protein
MNKALIAACCVLALASASASAEIYKWKDKAGKTQYSDSPPLSNIPYTTLSGKKAPPAAGAVPAAGAPANGQPPQPGQPKPEAMPKDKAAPNATGDDGDPNPSKHKVSEDLKEKAAKDEEAKKQVEEKAAAEKKAKDQACKDARSRLAQFQQGGRIYRVNEKGERDYYGDKEIEAELENAKSDVAANCE